MLFAKEREDETDQLLQVIAVRPQELMAGKLTYSIASLVLLMALLHLSAIGVTAISGGVAIETSIRNESQVYASYLHSIPLGLAASIFCSLLIQRVMWGLLLAVAVMLMLIVAAGTSPLFLQRNLSISTLFCAVILLLGSVPLVPVWLRGGPDWSRVKLIAASWFDYRRRFQLTRLLKWSASRASLSNRALAVIVWKELRTASWVLLAGLIVTSGWIPARFLIPYGTFHQSAPIVSTWLMCSLFGSWLLLGTLGLLSFSDDQRQRMNRFYAEHGVSPSLVWIGRQTVWLTVLLVLGAIATYMSIQFGLVSDPFQLNPRQPWSPPVPRQIAIIASYILCSYTTVQLLGQWFRNPILAAALGVIACSGLTFLHLLLMVFRIPLWLSSGPLIVATLMASFFLMDDWVKERWSWKHLLKRAAWIFVPLAISFAGMFIWRIGEIPLVDPGFDWRAHEREMAQSDPERTGQWQDLFDLATLPIAERQAMPKPFAERFREMAHQAVQQPQMRIDPEFLVNEPKANTLMFAFDRDRVQGIVGTEKTSLDEQWEDLQAALRMTFALANASPTLNEYAMSLSMNFSLRDKLRVWAQDPRQTTESLQRLIDCLPLVPSIPIKNNYITTRQAYYRTGWGKQTWIGTRLEDSIGHFPFTLLVGERERLVRLLNQQTNKAIARQAENILPAPRWNEISELTKWESTTPC
ncbi:hypothetical protein [Planctomicrobium sp. SH527]|uniref:hypothetical protein n=1 Tax=Planctomicrobium sp. SH527 TaxID=3448123 RepID=UPI003F5B3AB5